MNTDAPCEKVDVKELKATLWEDINDPEAWSSIHTNKVTRLLNSTLFQANS